MDVYLDFNLRRILKTSLEAILSAQHGRYCIHNLPNTLLFFLAMHRALHETHLYLANFLSTLYSVLRRSIVRRSIKNRLIPRLLIILVRGGQTTARGQKSAPQGFFMCPPLNNLLCTMDSW